MSNWKSVQLSSILPQEIVSAVTTVTDIVSQFIALEKQAVNIAKVYQSALGGGGPDILGTLIKAVVDIIEGALQAGKVHVLFIPITKHVPPEARSALPPTLEALTIEAGWDLEQPSVPFSSGSVTAYTELTGKTGGNAGFYSTFLQSLNDALDPSRPLYLSQGDAVAMTVLMLGAPAYSDAASYASTLGRIFKPPTNSDLAAGTVPVPQNLRARVLASQTSPRIAVRLDWDNAPPIFRPPYFPGVAIVVKRYAVIRSVNPAAAGASSVLDLFTTQDLKKGTTSPDQKKTSTVIATGNGLNSTFVDDEEELDKTLTYFYFVAWETSITESGKTTTFAFDRLSNVCKTRVAAPVPVKGVPPDWMAYGSPLALIPELDVQVKAMLEKIRALGDRQGGGVSGALSNALDMALANLDRLATQLDQANAAFAQLGAVFGAPLPGIYTTAIAGTGGNTFLAAELAKRLQDKTDTSRPPFDGDEYVLGVCIVAGGPRLPDIQPVIDLLASLFQPSAASNPLFDVLTSLDAVITTVEQRVFTQDMKSLTVAPDGTVTLPEPLPVPGTTTTISVLDVTEFDNNTGLPKAPDRPVIADDGTPIAGDAPNNPNAGNTNQKDPGELC